MKGEPTPGNWIAVRDNHSWPGYMVKSDAKPGYLAEVRACFAEPEVEANMKLILASKDLLAACQRAFEQTDKTTRGNDWEMLRAAIAKATK